MPSPASKPGTLRAYPRWMQALAMFCMALVLGATSVQASHLHGTWSPGHTPQLQRSQDGGPATPNGEADCPLCTVLHAAVAPSLAGAVQPLAPLALFRVAQVRFAPPLPPHFPARSRPPPAQG